MEKYAKITGKKISRISSSAIELIAAYGWPGNVRELENSIERAVVLCNDDTIHAHHLPPTIQSVGITLSSSTGPLESAIESLEREMVIESLRGTHGNMAASARMLGVTERMMGFRVKKYGINLESYHRSTDKGPRPE